MSTTLSKQANKSLSNWNAAIAEAKERIKELKNYIRTFESLRDEGMKFPEPKKATDRKKVADSRREKLKEKRDAKQSTGADSGKAPEGV